MSEYKPTLLQVCFLDSREVSWSIYRNLGGFYILSVLYLFFPRGLKPRRKKSKLRELIPRIAFFPR